MAVHFMIPSEVDHDDLTGHTILIGGVVWNEITERVSERPDLPVRQYQHPRLPPARSSLPPGRTAKKEFRPKWKDDRPKSSSRMACYRPGTESV